MDKLQVLVATMNMKNVHLMIERMNIKTDCLIINQCNDTKYENYKIEKSNIEVFSFNERGLSKSRNNALMRCTGDIICIADDDIVYSDTYSSDILNEFYHHPEAEAIVFNLTSNLNERTGKLIKSFSRVHLMESKEYGSVHIAFRRESVISRNVYFNILFGSGAKYNCGEDTIFLKDLIMKGLKLYKSPVVIGAIDMTSSTWFKGYNEKYFFTKGALISCMYKNFRYVIIIIQSLRNSKRYLGSYKNFFDLYKWYSNGANDYVNFMKLNKEKRLY